MIQDHIEVRKTENGFILKHPPHNGVGEDKQLVFEAPKEDDEAKTGEYEALSRMLREIADLLGYPYDESWGANIHLIVQKGKPNGE